MAGADLLNTCVARLKGEYRCLLRPNGSQLWMRWVGPGWVPVTDRHVLQALRGVADANALTAVLLEMQQDSRVALLPGEPMPELSEEPHATQFFTL